MATEIPIDLEQVRTLAAAGHTQGEIAARVGVSVDTLQRRKKASAAFADALKRGQETAHSTVSNALYQEAVKGNVTAIIWYEKTRRGMTDRIAQEISGPDGGPVMIREVLVKLPTDATLEP